MRVSAWTARKRLSDSPASGISFGGCFELLVLAQGQGHRCLQKGLWEGPRGIGLRSRDEKEAAPPAEGNPADLATGHLAEDLGDSGRVGHREQQTQPRLLKDPTGHSLHTGRKRSRAGHFPSDHNAQACSSVVPFCPHDTWRAGQGGAGGRVGALSAGPGVSRLYSGPQFPHLDNGFHDTFCICDLRHAPWAGLGSELRLVTDSTVGGLYPVSS